jgi:DNA-binding IclR family transcriptional regulator
MLAILDELAHSGPVLTADTLITRLGYSRGTGYRYIKALMDRGLLQRLAGGYGLGPRITELDFQLRESDPVLSLLGPTIRQLSEEMEAHALLAQFFDDRVVVTVQEIGTSQIKVSYGRGRRLPLFRGAPSKALLAALPRNRQRKLFDAHAAEIAAAGLGRSWDEFRASLVRFARERFVRSFGELDTGNVGVAVAIRGPEAGKPLALALVFSERRYALMDKSELERRLQRVTEYIADRLGDVEQKPLR